MTCFGASGSASVAASRMISMPNPGSTVSILSQSSRVRRFGVDNRIEAIRIGTAMPVRDATKQQIEAPRSQSFRRECLAQRDDQLAGVAADGFGRADRLGEHAAHLDQVRQADRIDRLGETPHGLVEPAAD
jgi:hypothetical protein